jgi:hypothetical protein
MVASKAYFRIIYGLILSIKSEAENLQPDEAQLLLEGVTGWGKGFWRMDAASHRALAALAANDFDPTGLKLNRDHTHARKEFYEEILTHPDLSFESFMELWEKYGRTILVTKDENPNRGSGFGKTYTEADIVLFDAPIHSHKDGTVPYRKAARETYRAAYEKL